MNLKRFFAPKFAIKFFVFAVLLYFVPLAALSYFQEALIFLPSSEHVDNPEELGLTDMQIVSIKTPDGLMLQDWFRPPTNGDKYTVVLFHGSFVNLRFIALIIPFLQKSDHGLFLCEYRGFGASPGSPTEQGVYTDARAAVEWLAKNGHPADHLIFYGSSLGTGVAVEMAVETPPAMVILHSPYARLYDVVKRLFPFYPINFLLRNRFDSVDKIGKIHAPVLILHGDDDSIIPIANARKLFEAANHPKYFIEAKGWGHNDLFFNKVIYKRIGAWIDQQIALIDASH